jgi:hypothetical protein
MDHRMSDASMLTRILVIAWVVAACIVGLIWLRDQEREVHGDVDPIFCTDCPQFERWLEEHDG